MPSFRCTICFDTIDSAAKPMAARCGHIYCLDCATFQFTRTDATCALCRCAQSLDQLVRLYPEWEGEDPQKNATNSREEDSVSSSPVSVRSIDRVAEETARTIKYALADRKSPQEAFLACNTFVNSVPERAVPHVNTDLLHEIAFQLNMMSTKMNDENSRLDRIRQNAQSARANETRLNLQVDQQRIIIDRLEKDNSRFASRGETLAEQNALLRQQCTVSGDDAMRQRVRTAKAENTLEEVMREKDEWMQKAVKLTKKYYALKNKVDETKRAASHAQRTHAPNASDDFVVI